MTRSTIRATTERIAWHAIALSVIALLLLVLLVTVQSLEGAARGAESPQQERVEATRHERVGSRSPARSSVARVALVRGPAGRRN